MHGVRAFLRCAIAGFDEELHCAASGAQQLDALRLEQRAGVRDADGQEEQRRYGTTQQQAAQPVHRHQKSVHRKFKNKKPREQLAGVVCGQTQSNQYIFGGNCMLRTRL